MNHQTKLSFLVLLVLKEILSTQIALPSFKYDISASLADWIAKILGNNKVSNINSALKNAFASAEDYKIPELEYNTSYKVYPFQSKIIFYDTTFYTHPTDAERTIPFTLQFLRLSDNKIRLSTKHFRITLKGEIRAKRNKSYANYFTTLHFDNFVLDAIRVSDETKDVKFFSNFSYERYYIWNYASHDEIEWPLLVWFQSYLSNDERKNLKTVMKPILPLMLHEHMNRNPKFSEAFDQIAKIYNEPSEIISAYPNFLEQRQQYYYLISQIRFYGFSLRNVIVQGLLNIESLDMGRGSPFFTHTLLMKNIVGNMTLDYGFENQPPLELNYFIDYLSISIKNGTDFVFAEAKSYSVNRKTGAPLTRRQSANIIQKIECAVASALMPSKRAWKTCDIESDIGQIDITNVTDWKMIEKKYDDSIPFNQADDADAAKKSGLMQRMFHAAAGRFLSSG